MSSGSRSTICRATRASELGVRLELVLVEVLRRDLPGPERELPGQAGGGVDVGGEGVVGGHRAILAHGYGGPMPATRTRRSSRVPPPGHSAHDLLRDVRARRPHPVGEPRPGVPGRGRAARGDRARGGGPARRPQPVRARDRDPGPPPGHRAAPAAPLRPRPRPGHAGGRDDRVHRGHRGRPAGAGQPRRRGRGARALLRLLRGDDPDGRRGTPPGHPAGSPTSGSRWRNCGRPWGRGPGSCC